MSRFSSKALACAGLWLVLGTAGPLPAQRYQVRVYGEATGLPSSNPLDMAQDSTGRLWVIAGGSLVSYDGSQWTSHDEIRGLPGDDRSRVLVDELDRVWALPRSSAGRVYCRESGTWRKLPRLPPGAEHGQLRAATTLRRGDDVLLLVAFAGLGTFATDGQHWQRLAWPEAVRAGTITVLQAFGRELCIGTTDGLFRVDLSLQQPRRDDAVAHDAVRGLSANQPGTELWVMSDRWLGQFSSTGFERVVEDFAIAEHSPNAFVGPVVDTLGGVYFGGTRRLFRFHASDGVATIGRNSGTLDEGATSLLVDREGNVWIGCRRGLSKLVSMRLASFDTGHGLLQSEVTAVIRRNAGEIVLGHPLGLTLLGTSIRTIDLEIGPSPRAKVLDLEMDTAGNLWIAAQGKGLGRLSPQGTLSWQDLDSHQPDGTVSVLQDSAGRLWVSESRKLFRRTPGAEFHHVPVPLLEDQLVYYRKLFRGQRGRVLVATSQNGVVVFEGDSHHFWLSSGAQRFNNVFAVLDEPDGTTWIGTLAGLCRIEGGRIVKTTAPGPVLDRPVYLLMRDPQNRLWCGTDDGINRWDGRAWQQFTVEDGLAGRETYRDGGLIDVQGDVWIGTENGVSVYRDRYELADRPPPCLRLLSIEVDGEAHDPGQPLMLGSSRSSVVFRFQATGLADEDRLLFRYRLSGFEDHWLGPESIPDQSVRYTNLPAGDYRFESQVKGHEQPWSPVVASANIQVAQPLWLRPWFLALTLLTGGLMLTGSFKLVTRNRYLRRLEREVQIRMAENRRLEDEQHKVQRLESLGVLAGGIAHDFNNLLAVMMGSFSLLEYETSSDQERASICRDGLSAARRARSLTQQLLTFSKGGAPLLRTSSLADVVRESVSFVMRGSDLSYQCELASDLWMVKIDPDQISQVIGNLLLNAKQASSSGGSILVRGRNRELCLNGKGKGKRRYVEVSIRDYGTGIATDRLNRIFEPYYSTKEGGSGLGLATSYSIAQHHGSELQVESTLGQGSTFRLLMPAVECTPEAEPTPSEPPACRAGLRVLVMDDDDAVVSVLRRMLRQLGHHSVVTENGTQAIAQYEAAMRTGQPFDAVLMDLTIPGGVGGKEAVIRLLAADPAAQAIVLSGYSNDPVLAGFAEYGFVAGLSKPVTIEELAQALQAIPVHSQQGQHAD